jgi:hypothetical protein
LGLLVVMSQFRKWYCRNASRPHSDARFSTGSTSQALAAHHSVDRVVLARIREVEIDLGLMEGA